jgi:hypothetical protein
VLDYFSGFEPIWGAWAASAALSLWLTLVAVNRIRWRHIRSILIHEDGAAYTLSYVMTVPLYILLICAFVETSLMLIAKIGTVYSAFAGARTAIVWNTAADVGTAEDKVRMAVVRTMTPFASGLAEFRKDPPGSWGEPSGDAKAYLDAYRDSVNQGSGTPGSARYVWAKYRYAQRATKMTVAVRRQEGGEVWDEDIEVTVEYAFPFNIPILGKAMGTAQGGEYVYPIASSITLQNECPRNEQKRLGISYASAE